MRVQSALVVVLSIIAVSAAAGTPACYCAVDQGIKKGYNVQCPMACNLDHNPVCGFNPCLEGDMKEMFKTFSNRCFLESTVCDGKGNLYYVVADGECFTDG